MKPAVRAYTFDALDVRASAGYEPPSRARSSERATSVDSRSKLERNYPAIANSIRLLWGYPEMNEYFAKLWLADGRSEPIDPEVMADLMLLARVHQELLPARPKASMASIYGSAYGERPVKPDVWGSSPRVR